MPVTLQWHSSLPVLLATYSGMLTADEYYDMCNQRRTLIDDGPDSLILLADLRQMEAFAESGQITPGDNILRYNKVYRTLIVLQGNLYRSLLRAIEDTAGQDHLVYFFWDVNTALDQAQTLLSRLD